LGGEGAAVAAAPSINRSARKGFQSRRRIRLIHHRRMADTLHQRQLGPIMPRHHGFGHILLQQIGPRAAQHQHRALFGKAMPFAPWIGVAHDAGQRVGNRGVVIGNDLTAFFAKQAPRHGQPVRRAIMRKHIGIEHGTGIRRRLPVGQSPALADIARDPRQSLRRQLRADIIDDRPGNQIGMARGQFHRDQPAHRCADKLGPPDAQPRQQRGDILDISGNIIAFVRIARRKPRPRMSSASTRRCRCASHGARCSKSRLLRVSPCRHTTGRRASPSAAA
jgi:hypothetical protein